MARRTAETMIRRSIPGCLTAAVLLCLLLVMAPVRVHAAETTFRYINPQTGYGALIDDEMDLLSEEEEALLLGDMLPITEYGNVLFISAYPLGMSSVAYANRLFMDISRGNSAVFMIDMYNREISLSHFLRRSLRIRLNCC